MVWREGYHGVVRKIFLVFALTREMCYFACVTGGGMGYDEADPFFGNIVHNSAFFLSSLLSVEYINRGGGSARIWERGGVLGVGRFECGGRSREEVSIFVMCISSAHPRITGVEYASSNLSVSFRGVVKYASFLAMSLNESESVWYIVSRSSPSRR